MKISEATRRDIFDLILRGNIRWSGRLEEPGFLTRIFDLESMPSTDGNLGSFSSAFGLWRFERSFTHKIPVRDSFIKASEFLTISEAFLERDRWAGARIPFIKIGSRAVRYRFDDLQAYLAAPVLGYGRSALGTG